MKNKGNKIKDLEEKSRMNRKEDNSAILSEKERSFVNIYLKSGNATESAYIAGYGSNRKSAAVMGHRLLKSPKIQEAISQEFSKFGISDAILYRNLLEGLYKG